MRSIYQKIKLSLYKTLRWSQKYTKTDMIYLTKGMSWLTLGQVVSAIASFLFAIAVANLLPKEIYGTYKFVISMAGFLAILTLSGTNIAIIRATARGYDGALKQGLSLRLRWSALASLATFGVAGYYFLNNNTELALAMMVVAIFMPVMESFTVYQSLLSAKSRFDTLAKYNIVAQVVAYSILISSIFITDSLFLILLSYFVPWTILRGVFLFLSYRKLIQNTKEEPGMPTYSRHLTAMNILAVSANHIDKILLFHFLGAVETAIYSIAIAMPGQINSMLKNIKVISRSKFTTRKLTDIEKNFKKRLLMFLAVVIAVIVSYVLASPLVFKLLFPQYLDSIFYSQVFSISLLGSLAFVYTALLEAKKQVRKLYLFNTVSYGTQILLMVVMIPIWGLMGAVLAKVVGQIVSLCFGYLLIKFDESTELDTTEGTI